MNAKSLLEQTIYWSFCLCLVALPASTYGQDPFPAPTPTPDPLAGVAVQVLDQQQVTVGTQTIIFNRLAPPVFPAATPPPPPQAISANSTTNRIAQTVPTKRTSSRSAQTRARKTIRSAQSDGTEGVEKSYKMLSFSATVYDHQFTEVRWFDGSEPALRAYVNLDFCYFTTVTTVETADTVYDLIFAWGNDTVDSLTQAGQQLPDFSSVAAGHADYQVLAGDPNAHPNAIAALNALCAFYDNNGAQMIAAYNQQQASKAAYQQWLQTHPPVRQDTVINYWPIKSGIYLQSH